MEISGAAVYSRIKPAVVQMVGTHSVDISESADILLPVRTMTNKSLNTFQHGMMPQLGLAGEKLKNQLRK